MMTNCISPMVHHLPTMCIVHSTRLRIRVFFGVKKKGRKKNDTKRTTTFQHQIFFVSYQCIVSDLKTNNQMNQQQTKIITNDHTHLTSHNFQVLSESVPLFPYLLRKEPLIDNFDVQIAKEIKLDEDRIKNTNIVGQNIREKNNSKNDFHSISEFQ